MKKKEVFRCKYCGRRFDSEQALASHLRVHKKKKEKARAKKEDDDPPQMPSQPQNENIQPQPQLLAQPQQYQQPQPVPQYVPPSPNDYFFPNQPRVIQNQQVQAQPQQSGKKYDWVDILIGLLSTPTVQGIFEVLQNRNSNSGGGEDLISKLAYQQMIEAWKEEYERGKRYYDTQLEMMKIAWQKYTDVMKRKKHIIIPIPREENDEKEKKLISALVELKKKLDNVTDKFNELLDEEEEEEDGEFV